MIVLFDEFRGAAQWPAEPCEEWTGHRDRQGYGKRHVNGKVVYAHRHVWESHFGAIPDGMFVLHRCDKPSCVNPDHLFLGTHQDNMNDMRNKKRARNTRQVGELNHNAKLTENDVRRIKVMIKIGRPSTHIARDFGVSHYLISSIKRGKLWCHVS